jgi:hypothetical protein
MFCWPALQRALPAHFFFLATFFLATFFFATFFFATFFLAMALASFQWQDDRTTHEYCQLLSRHDARIL